METVNFEFTHFDEFINFNTNEIVNEFINKEEDKGDDEKQNYYFQNNNIIPIMKFSFYENGKILNVNFADKLDEKMINLLNESLYEIVPDISQNSNLRILQSKDSELESIFQKEKQEIPNFGGVPINNSIINLISNHTINNEIEKITEISSFGEAILLNNGKNEDKDDNFNTSKFSQKQNDKMMINESTSSILVLSTNNGTINEIIKLLNEKINYTEIQNKNSEFLSLNTNNNTENISYRKLNGMNKFKETYSFNYLLFKDSFFGIGIQILIKIECKLSQNQLNILQEIHIGNERYNLYYKKIKTNTGEVIQLYIDEINEIKKVLDHNYEVLRIKIKKDWNKEIKELLNNLSIHLDSVYDISKLYNGVLKDLLQIFVDSSKDLFNGIKNDLLMSKTNLEKITNKLLKNEIDLITDMLEDIRKQYINIINNSEDNAGKIQVRGLKYIEDIHILIEGMENFDLSLLFKIKEQLERPVNFFNDYNQHIFILIKNGIKIIKTILLNYQEEQIGEDLYNLEFYVNGLTISPVLKSGITEEEREYFIKIINSIINEIDKQLNIIYYAINDNYKQDIEIYGKQFSNNIQKKY